MIIKEFASGTWVPYSGASAIILAAVLAGISVVCMLLARKISAPITWKQPGTLASFLIIAGLVASTLIFLRDTVYVSAEFGRQLGPAAKHIVIPRNPITPVTLTAMLLSFFIIVYITQQLGFKGAYISGIVGAIAAPMLFEFPFDCIVMWRAILPEPPLLYMTYYFLPLICIELFCFAMLTFSPMFRITKLPVFIVALLFLEFAIWALFGFSYPMNPISITMNIIAKLTAFAVAITLFIPEKTSVQDQQ